MTVRIKICGITRLEDALLAEELGASAVGFVFYPKSRRYISPEEAGVISRKLGPFIARIGVFVNEATEIVQKVVCTAGLTAVQLHGTESPDYVDSMKSITPFLIKAFRVGDRFDSGLLKHYNVTAYLLDTESRDDCFGGSGGTFDWTNAIQCTSYGRVILAGGLTPSNVRDAVLTVRPWAVDVSSGIERSPGLKDEMKMRDFISAVTSAGKECVV